MPTSDRAPRRELARNRQALIEAARDVFAEDGIDAPTDAIARRAGLGNATLYRYFPSREPLVMEALRTNLRRHLHEIKSAQHAATGWQGFQRYTAWLFGEQLADRGLTQELLSVRRGLDAEVDELRKVTLDGIQELIARAKSEGEFRLDRWMDDVLLLLNANDHLAQGGGEGAHVASNRLYELMIATLGTSSSVPAAPTTEPASVVALRAVMAHRLEGLPLEPDDL